MGRMKTRVETLSSGEENLAHPFHQARHVSERKETTLLRKNLTSVYNSNVKMATHLHISYFEF